MTTLSTPAGLAEALMARGLAKLEAMTCMSLLHGDDGPRPDFGVRYLARVDGEVVGKGFLCLDAGAPGLGAITG